MAFDFNEVDNQSNVSDSLSLNFEENCSYITRGYITRGNKLTLRGIRKFAGFDDNFQFMPFITWYRAYEQLILNGITSTQYVIILTWDIDLTQVKLYPPKNENQARDLSRPLLIFNHESSEKHSEIIDMTSDKILYKFLGMAFLKRSEDGSYLFFEMVGDYCNIPIINKTC